jgi:uncharacterized surface protein with fasciclin (FAS1) repeats
MKIHTILCLAAMIVFACGTNNQKQEQTESTPSVEAGGQSNVQDEVSQKDIVHVAVSSPDHKTLVTALKAASYVDALSNAGPFTVFAPTDEAFAKLPAGTVESLVKPENKGQLQNILEYHVYVGVIRENMIATSVSALNQVNGKNVSLKKDGDNLYVNDAKIIGTVPASNGIIYVIDKVLLPPEK